MLLSFYSRLSFIVFFVFNVVFWLNYNHDFYAGAKEYPHLVGLDMGSSMSIGFIMLLGLATHIIYYLYALKILAHTYKVPERQPYGKHFYYGSILILCVAWVLPSLLFYPFSISLSYIFSLFAIYFADIIELMILIAVLCLHKGHNTLTRMSYINILILISFFSLPYWIHSLEFYSELGYPLQGVSKFAFVALFECSSLILLQLMSKKGLFTPSKKFM